MNNKPSWQQTSDAIGVISGVMLLAGGCIILAIVLLVIL